MSAIFEFLFKKSHHHPLLVLTKMTRPAGVASVWRWRRQTGAVARTTIGRTIVSTSPRKGLNILICINKSPLITATTDRKLDNEAEREMRVTERARRQKRQNW